MCHKRNVSIDAIKDRKEELAWITHDTQDTGYLAI